MIQSDLYVHENNDNILADEHMRSSKRIKTDLLDNVSEESRPLGLALKKSPSLLDLIQRKVFGDRNDEDNSVSCNADIEKEKEKMKASNFPASSLKIGSWEKISVNEGNVVTKCYFAKRKLVWEILECKLKRKIEIQWSDISAIRATFQEKQCSVLLVEVKRPPLFFEEKDPQPKKHTLWHPTADFTGGQASSYRIHRLEFAEGMLKKHYQKLVAYDKQLKIMSQKPFPSSNSPYFQFIQDCSNNLNSYDLDLVSRFNHPYHRNSSSSYHNGTLHTSVRNSIPIPFHPHTMQGNVATSSNSKFHNISAHHIPNHPSVSFSPARHIQNFGLSRVFTRVPDTTSPNFITDLTNYVRPLTIPNLVEPTFQKSAPCILRTNEYAMPSNHLRWNSCSEGIYDKLLHELKDHIGSSDPSNIWDLEDIIDHLFSDRLPSIASDDEGLMRKIRSIDAHLNKLPEASSSDEISKQENDVSGTVEA